MTPEQSAAYVVASAARLTAIVAGMQAANQHRLSLGYSIAYDEEAFDRALSDAGIGQNEIVAMFFDARK